MLRTLRNLALCLTSLLPLQASSPVPADWTRTDTVVETAVLVAMYCDWRQTREFARTPFPEGKELVERNPFLGEHPSPASINRFFAGCAVLHVWLAMQLGPEWRHRWQGLQLGISVVCIANNAKLGVRLKF